MFLPCPSCKAELSPALVGADGRCPYCGTLAVTAAAPSVSPPAAAPKPRITDPNDPDDTVPSPRARVEAPVGAVDEAAAPRKPEPGGLPRGWGGLAVGARGILHGKPAQITGRARFTVDRPKTIGWWDAWAIRYSDGAEGWILDREGSLASAFPWKIQTELDPTQLSEGRLVRLDGGPPSTVVDLGTAVVRGVEGATDFEAGMRLHFATLAGDQWRYQLLWSQSRPLQCWRGERIESAMMAAGFGLRAPSGLKESAATSFEWVGQLPLSMQVVLLLLAIPVVAGAAMWLLFGRFAALFE